MSLPKVIDNAQVDRGLGQRIGHIISDLRRFAFRVRRYWARTRSIRRRLKKGSYVREGTGEIRRIVSHRAVRLDAPAADERVLLAANYCRNRFDLLGTGWVEAIHGVSCRGFRGHRYDAPAKPSETNVANRMYASRLEACLSERYRRIDWQRDFRSGYRWDESAPSDHQPIGVAAGADIKVPWELGKLQHLPQLAVTFASGEHDWALVRAFRDQTLDFIAANPPGFGVQWSTAMLAGIRAANILVAYDIFRAADVLFDEAFRNAVYRSMLDHAHFILANLEWWVDDHRNNHFLANLAGLAAICAYLPRTPETDDMLSFVLRGVNSEITSQFNRDGSGVEGSTGYHAFAAECVGWATIFLESIPEGRRESALTRKAASLPAFARRVGWSFIRLTDTAAAVSPATSHGAEFRAINSFLIDCLDDNDRIVQIGDNDSGRFLKLRPSVEVLPVDTAIARYGSLDGYTPPPDMADYVDEDLLAGGDVAALLGAVSGSPRFSDMATVDYRIAWDFLDASGEYAAVVEPRLDTPTTAASRDRLMEPGFIDASGSLRIVRSSPGGEVRLRSYPQFGLYVYRAADFLMYIRCGGLLTLSPVGHPHNDQLAIDLSVDGEHIIQDPGTFVYTAAPVARELYRSRSAHFVPAWKPANGRTRDRMFSSLRNQQPGLVHSVRHNRFEGTIIIDGMSITRTVVITDSEIVVEDRDEDGKSLNLSDAFHKVRMLPPSAGYGKTVRTIGSALTVEA